MTEYPEYNPLDEMEYLPPLSELEQLQEDYSELRKKYAEVKKTVEELGDVSASYAIIKLKKLFKIC